MTKTQQTPRSSVVVFRSDLLRLSEHFIMDQVCAMSRVDVTLLGSRLLPGWSPGRGVRFATGSRQRDWRDISFRATGRSRRLRHLLDEARADLLHAHFGPDATMIRRVADHSGLPLMVTFHGYDVTTDDGHLRGLNWASRRFVKERADLAKQGVAFIAVSNFIGERLSDLGFAGDRIFVEYIGIDFSGRALAATPPAGPPTVAFVGRLAEVKGVHVLIKAFREVRRAIPQARLLIAGDGPQRAEVHAAAGTGVTFVGSLPPESVHSFLCDAHVVCVPSVRAPSGAVEAFGLASVEGQAAGRPVVASRIGGLPETLLDGETGHLVAPGDAGELATALIQLLRDPDLAARLGSAGSEFVRRRFDILERTSRLENHYLRLAAGDGLQRPTRNVLNGST